ncbi:MAG: hypothetical protein VKJ24_21840, partial [Synechococcales bacterium]|nr:hypothetical protein [Synechococcales bacterium]
MFCKPILGRSLLIASFVLSFGFGISYHPPFTAQVTAAEIPANPTTPVPNTPESLPPIAGDRATQATLKKLTGTWALESIVPPGAESNLPQPNVLFIFTPDGQLTFMIEQSRGAENYFEGYRVDYRVYPHVNPQGMDVTISTDPRKFQTIFEFLRGDRLWLEWLDVVPGQARPTQFKRPLLFKKISDSTQMPANLKLFTGDDRLP